MMNSMMMNNMANMMAEDSGLMELRNPKRSGMHRTGWFFRFFIRKY